MPDKDTGIDVPEMPPQVGPQQDDSAEGMPEVQDYTLGYTESSEITRPEEVNYRVTMKDFGCVENDTLFIEYYRDFYSALGRYDALCDDESFIKHHDKPSVFVDLERAVRGYGQVFWELIKRNIVYDDN